MGSLFKRNNAFINCKKTSCLDFSDKIHLTSIQYLNFMIKQIRHTGIVVQNLEKCLEFFIDYLGFEVEREMDERGPFLDSILGLNKAIVKTVKIKATDGSMLELLKFKSHKVDAENSWKGEIYSTGLTHIALTVENIDELYDSLCSNGIVFNSPPQISPDGYAKVTFCKGPENLFLELVEVIG